MTKIKTITKTKDKEDHNDIHHDGYHGRDGGGLICLPCGGLSEGLAGMTYEGPGGVDFSGWKRERRQRGRRRSWRWMTGRGSSIGRRTRGWWRRFDGRRPRGQSASVAEDGSLRPLFFIFRFSSFSSFFSLFSLFSFFPKSRMTNQLIDPRPPRVLVGSMWSMPIPCELCLSE